MTASLLLIAGLGMSVAGCRRQQEQARSTSAQSSDDPSAERPSLPPGTNVSTATAERQAQRARVAVAGLKAALKQALKGSLPKGLDQAIASCQLKAPQVAAAVKADTGVELGRSSSRLRNPANVAKGWTVEMLKRFQADPAGKWPPQRTERLPDGRLGYAEPIVTQAVCLKCHGKQLEPAVVEALAGRYPQDKARGYAEGDLRGIFWAVVGPPRD